MAVQAGLTLRHSNGQTEGQVNRLKLLKRQGYGAGQLRPAAQAGAPGGLTGADIPEHSTRSCLLPPQVRESQGVLTRRGLHRAATRAASAGLAMRQAGRRQFPNELPGRR